ncbi:MAG: Uma2 family endonuclease [Planctomycetaceae bacterium]|nr:Uma2 family endonuclease [Planctomycetaceae bacterium]
MSADLKIMTAEELLALRDDGMRHELVQGVLREMPPAGHEHGDIAYRVGLPFGPFVDEHNLGTIYAAETGFLISQDPDTVRAPDLAFVTRERCEKVQHRKGYFPGPPDLAVEVVSPEDRLVDVEDKVADWLAAGCQMVLVVNPRNRTVKVHRSLKDQQVLTIDDVFDGGDLLPGFQFPIRQIFPR